MFSIMQVSGVIDVERAALGDKATEPELYKKLIPHAEGIRQGLRATGRTAGHENGSNDAASFVPVQRSAGAKVARTT